MKQEIGPQAAANVWNQYGPDGAGGGDVPLPPQRPEEFGPSAGALPTNPLFNENMQMPDLSGGIAPAQTDQTDYGSDSVGISNLPGIMAGQQGYNPLAGVDVTGGGQDWQASSGVATSTASQPAGGATGSWDTTAPAQTDQAGAYPNSTELPEVTVDRPSNLPAIMASQQGSNPLAGVDVTGGGAAQDTTAPAQTDQLPIMASGASPELQTAGLGQADASSFPTALPADTSGGATDTGVQTATYNGQTYTYATPGGPQTAQYYQGPDNNAPTAPAQTQTDTGASSSPGSDNLPLMASGAAPQQQAAGLQDQSALSSDGATSGLPGPLKQILGGQPPGSDAAAPDKAQADSGQGSPVDITDASKIAGKAGEAIAKGLQEATKTLGKSAQELGQVQAQDTSSLVQAASKADQQAADIAQTTLSHFSNLFQRGMVAFLGLVLIGGAVYYFSKHQASAT